MMQAQPESRRMSITALGRGPSVATSPRQTISSAPARAMSARTARSATSFAWMSEMSAMRTTASSSCARGCATRCRLPVADWLQAMLQERDHLVVSALGRAGQAHEMLRQLGMLARDQQNPDLQEVD